MKEILNNKDLKQAIIRTMSNISKLGILGGASVFAGNLFRTQATSTIQGAQMDFNTVHSLIKGK